jgi:PiT family inorganic phosphate transporter
MGVGSTMGASTVKWGVARTIAFAWILTIPAAAVIGYGSFLIIRVFIGYY